MKNRMKYNISIQGKIEIYRGIPENQYTDEQITSMGDKRKFLCEPDLFYSSNNLIVSIGKKNILEKIFRPELPQNNFCVNKMVVGDGGYDFINSTKKYPSLSDTGIYREVSSRQDILSFIPVDGSDAEGWTKVMASTFSSSDFEKSNFSSTNQNDYFLNEAGLIDNGGQIFSHVVFPNYPFSPDDDFALTINWYITVL